MLLAWVRMLRGELAEGGEMLDAAIEEARLLGNAQSLAGLLLNRSLTALAAGTLSSLSARPRRASSSPARMDGGLVPAATGLALAGALLETGDPASPRPSSFFSNVQAAPGYRSCREAAFARSGSSC